MNKKIHLTKKDREEMRNTLVYSGTILNLNLRILAKSTLQVFTFNQDHFLTLGKEILSIRETIEKIKDNPEVLFFNEKELAKMGLDKVNNNQL